MLLSPVRVKSIELHTQLQCSQHTSQLTLTTFYRVYKIPIPLTFLDLNASRQIEEVTIKNNYITLT